MIAARASAKFMTPTPRIVEFRTADGEALAISVPASETRVLKHFQKQMPYGLFVPDADA